MGLYGKIIDLQKLETAWDHVRKNKPACGVDNVTYEEFENARAEKLKQLNVELAEHRYESLPVKLLDLYHGEKVRTIALFAMRDKVVQQSLAQELGKIYEPLFSPSAYAYRPGQSALQALERIEEQVKRDGEIWVLKMDIESFFDNLVHKKLLAGLRSVIPEEDVLDLVKTVLTVPVLDEKTGELSKNRKGVFQGASCAPILSNIYMMEYDASMEEKADFYIRYADDILVLERSEERARELLAYSKLWMEKNGLSLQEKKTRLNRLTETEGFEYLGYAFSTRGKSVPQKAKDSLAERLETMWLTSGLPLEQKLKKGSEIIGGWEQYFRDERSIESILEYVLVLDMALSRGEEAVRALEEQRFSFPNYYKDIAKLMVAYWKKRERPENVVREYEQFFRVPEQEERQSGSDSLRTELIACYEEFFVQPNEELYLNLIQLYTDMGYYKKASFFWEEKAKYDQAQDHPVPVAAASGSADDASGGDVDVPAFAALFVGREDTYVQEVFGDGNRRRSEQVMEPLKEEEIRRHLTGETILGTYVQRPNGTVRFLVLDVDISKKRILQHPYGSAEFAGYKQKAAEYTLNLCRILHRMGIVGYPEDTGFRGYHVWIFFTEWIPARYACQLSECIRKEAGQPGEDLVLEIFPNNVRIRPGKCGPTVKLPLGAHLQTGNRSFFVDEKLQPVADYRDFFSGISKTSLQAVRKILGTYLTEPAEVGEQKEVDPDLTCFGTLSEPIRIVLERCTLMRYLCQKAAKTGYLSHFERLSVLHVFGHMGEDGKEFVHTVMSLTLNYKYNVTQKFIIKMPEKPVSCAILREQYKLITAEYGCSCSFRQTKNCYPSPVLHALKNSGDDEADITLPVSRTVSKAKEEKVYEEINIHKQTQNLAQKVVELKKQQHGLEKAIRKNEMELQRIFDNAGIDCLEIEMGLLVRRKKGEGYEWLIEI